MSEALKSENYALRVLLSRAREYLYWVEDEGPSGEGWRSDGCVKLMAEIDKALGNSVTQGIAEMDAKFINGGATITNVASYDSDDP